MSVRHRMMLAAFLGGWLTQAGAAAEPPRIGLAPTAPLPAVAASPNQQLADTIGQHLRQSGQLRGYSVDVTVLGTTVELDGTVSSQPQREEVVRIVQGVPGVEKVRDRLRAADALTQVQAVAPGIPGSLPPATAAEPPRAAQPAGPGVTPTPLPPPISGGSNLPPVATGPAQPGAGPAAGPGPREPVPIFEAPGAAQGYNTLNPPRMPPYSWPTYAPYNNYSRVAYPEAYPGNAWPFIGPVHPFPKVPLGWRSVKLTWDDGYWWFSRTATKHDWWRLRFY